jgi:hypothetical protein
MNFTSPFTARTYSDTAHNTNNLDTTFGRSTATGTKSETYALGNTSADGRKAAVGGDVKRLLERLMVNALPVLAQMLIWCVWQVDFLDVNRKL